MGLLRITILLLSEMIVVREPAVDPLTSLIQASPPRISSSTGRASALSPPWTSPASSRYRFSLLLYYKRYFADFLSRNVEDDIWFKAVAECCGAEIFYFRLHLYPLFLAQAQAPASYCHLKLFYNSTEVGTC